MPTHGYTHAPLLVSSTTYLRPTSCSKRSCRSIPHDLVFVTATGGVCARTATRTGARRPVPRQLRHAERPVPAHGWHPASPSDHRAHRQATFPVPPHVAQPAGGRAPVSGRLLPAAAHLSAVARPASMPMPADAASTIGPTILLC